VETLQFKLQEAEVLTITTSDDLTEQIESLHLCVQNNAEELANVL
jgi:hypothetical protein